MGKEYLIDTNVILEYLGRLLPTKAHVFVGGIIENSFNVSIINRIEILGYNSTNADLETFMDLAATFQLTEEIANQTIDLRKNKKIKLPDSIIAATALVHGFTIISRNVKDFQNIVGLEYINPHELG